MIKESTDEEIKNIFDSVSDFDICRTVFLNPRITTNGAYKLTSKGHFVLNKIEQFSKCDIQPKDKLKGKNLIYFDNLVDCPWIIQGKKIYFFKGEIAMMFALSETFETFIYCNT